MPGRSATSRSPFWRGDAPSGWGAAPSGWGDAPSGWGDAPSGWGDAPSGWGDAPSGGIRGRAVAASGVPRARRDASLSPTGLPAPNTIAVARQANGTAGRT